MIIENAHHWAKKYHDDVYIYIASEVYNIDLFEIKRWDDLSVSDKMGVRYSHVFNLWYQRYVNVAPNDVKHNTINIDKEDFITWMLTQETTI